MTEIEKLEFLMSFIRWFKGQQSPVPAQPPTLRVRAEFSDSLITVEGELPMEYVVAFNQSIKFHIKGRNKNVADLPIEGAVWALLDGASGAELKPAADGFSADVIGQGVEAVVDVQAKADAKIGEGESFVIGTARVRFVRPQATELEITADDPVDIEAASGGTEPAPNPGTEPAPTEPVAGDPAAPPSTDTPPDPAATPIPDPNATA